MSFNCSRFFSSPRNAFSRWEKLLWKFYHREKVFHNRLRCTELIIKICISKIIVLIVYNSKEK